VDRRYAALVVTLATVMASMATTAAPAGSRRVPGRQSIKCPGCDLSGANLDRRDLTGADLSGATCAAQRSPVRSFAGPPRRANLAGAPFSGRLAGATFWR